MSMIAIGAVIVLVVITAVNSFSTRRMDAAHRTQVLASSNPALRQTIVERKIQRGMTEQEVIASWGQPTTITRQALKTKTKVTLRYGTVRGGSAVYVENGIVTGWKQNG
ncbi:MAG: hypothetical protein ACRYGM_05200 [Janthinobacterium lividum]